jgi:hypothetical protein
MIKISEKSLATISVASICTLSFIWVLPNTIALRHFCLAIGALSGISLISRNRSYFNSVKPQLFPLFCIASLFVWVLIHYYFFSLNPGLELSEIKGLWMRAALGFFASIGLGISLVTYPSLKKYFYISLFFTPAINVASYCWASYLHGAFVSPNDFIGFLFKKIETGYFGAVAGALATGNLIYLLTSKAVKGKVINFVWNILGLSLVLVSALVSNTKNGMAVALGLCIFLALVLFFNTLLNKASSKVLSAIGLALVLILAGGIWHGHKTLASAGWSTIVEDAKAGIEIDKNQQWQKTEGSVPMPLNSLGITAAGNTYTRFAYAAVGVRLISEYPLGYGSINSSFAGLQEYALVPHEHQGQVHSGWIDLGLAFGLPGLGLVFLTMLSIIYFALKNRSALVLPWATMCLAFIPFGLIAEITWKQYFEATIFFLVLGATIVALSQIRSRNS